jgi:tagatose 1,6-diphosphate aldolase
MIGKLRAVQRSTTRDGHFAVLALDHADALRRALKPHTPESVTDAEMTAFKLDVLEALQEQASAVLLDPVHGAAQAVSAGLAPRCGLLVELEKADYQLQPLPLDFEIRPGWSVAKIKRMGGDGVKLFYYYHPEQQEHAERQNHRLREVVAACATQDVPLYLEPILYGLTDVSDLPRLVRQSAMDAAAAGADVLKLEFPAPANEPERWAGACEAISVAVDKPWTLLSAGVDFDTYCAQVEAACRAGVSGYIAGRAVWGDACAIPDRDQRRTWLATEGRARLARLNEITARFATSFRARWPEVSVGPAWFAKYESPED